MKRINIHMGLGILCIGLFAGCGKAQRVPRFDGIVVISADNNSTSWESDLIRGNQVSAGRDYNNPQKTNWNALLKWDLKKLNKKNDVYLFEWGFIPADGDQVISTSEIEYNGAESVIVLQNESQTITIEPGYIPLPENAQNI